MPAQRWDHTPFFDPTAQTPDTAYTDALATVAGIEDFDPLSYGISPRQAEVMDPQHRILLAATREALEDAGLDHRTLTDRRVGVYVGISSSDFRELMTAGLRTRQLGGGEFGAGTDSALDDLASAVPPVRAFTMPGSLLNMAAAAVSRTFNLRGPSLAVDAACASSLVALHNAALALRTGQCDIAVVAGVHVNLVPDGLVLFSKIGAVSKSGVCAPFSAAADGFVLGEGVGVVVLAREHAVPHGSDVFAWLRGIACNNDGAGAGAMEPQVAGQQSAIELAMADAGTPAADVDYIEAHGTATSVGDAVEVEALSACLPPRDKLPRYLGSAKANVGHTMSAAGVVGLIKAALVLRHGVVPPHPHLDQERDDLRLSERGLALARQCQQLPDVDRPHVAGVSAFGFGGTNVHAVLEAARLPEPRVDEPVTSWLVPIRGRDAREVALRCRSLLDDIEAATELGPLVKTLARRTDRGAELLVVTGSAAELRDQLQVAADILDTEAPVPGRIADDIWYRQVAPSDTAPGVCFLFPGQGSQSVSDAETLHAMNPAVRQRIQHLAENADSPGLLDVMYPARPGATSADALASTDRCQPALLVNQLAIVGLLDDSGITPDVTLGHSVGEFSAAAAAGVMTFEDAVAFAARRGQAIVATDIPAGGMLACRANELTLRGIVEQTPSVWIANVNSAEQTVLAGEHQALTRVADQLAAADIGHKALDVSHAFHSPLLEPANRRIVQSVDALTLTAPRVPLISCLSGNAYRDADDIRQAWHRHALAPVRFDDALQTLTRQPTVCIEIGPGSTLLNLARVAGVPQTHLLNVGDIAGDTDRAVNRLRAGLRALGVDISLQPADHPRGALLSTPRMPEKSLWPLKFRGEKTIEVVADIPAPPPVGDGAEVAPARIAHPAPTKDRKGSTVDQVVALCREQTALIAKMLDGHAPASEPLTRDLGDGTHEIGAPESASAGTQLGAVIAEIARVGSYDVDLILPEQTLVGDLGFDSLMLTELLNRLRRRHPGLDMQGISIVDLTVGAVAALVEREPGSADISTPISVVPDAPVTPAPTELIKRERGITDFPEWQSLKERLSAAELPDIENPYFTLHERVVNDTTQMGGRVLINYSSYNYLGLSGEERVSRRAQEAIARYGTSVSASRLLSGEKPLHRELDAAIAGLLQVEDALTLVGGHSTNVTTIGHLLGDHDIVLHDALAHDSIMQGCHLSGATRRPFRHNDAAHLRQVLSEVRGRHRRALVVIEGAYSMDGDIADLPAFIDVAKEHDAMLMVDEAHSIGVLGAHGGGVGEYFGIDRSQVDIWMGTLSKSLSSCGGYLGGSHELIQYLRYTLPGFIYSCGLPPASAAASLASIQVMQAEPGRIHRLHVNADHMRAAFAHHGLSCEQSKDTPIIPFVVGDSMTCLALASRLRTCGVNVDPIMYPAVPNDQARLRFFVTAAHSFEQIDTTVEILARESRKLTDLAIA